MMAGLPPPNVPDGKISLQPALLLVLKPIQHHFHKDARGKLGDVTSPSTARATKGFLYIIRRGGFIYLFIYLFFYIYIRERVFLF